KIWASPAVAAAELSEPRRRGDEGLARLHRFVDDSLRLTPLTTEEAAVFSVMAVIDEARRECVPGPEGGIQIETRPASANPRCRGHRGRLVLAVLNLLRNAVQVGGTGVRIQISIDARVPRQVTIGVRDDGPGIPEAHRDTLFTNGVSHRHEGFGHGLSFVRQVVETEMGGRARLVSPPGEAGACFELELPTVEGEP
ncbi:MAG: sensor histidine kinase, partial [Myxococcales bacterium]|nr:sensor histidine kinase [Myxococcales bacterium]